MIEVCSMMSYTGDQLPRLLCVVYAAIISLATKHVTTVEPELITISAAIESTECSLKSVWYVHRNVKL